MANYPASVANLQAELRLESSSAAVAALTGLTNQAKLLSEYSQGVRQIANVSQEQFKFVAQAFEKKIAPLLTWLKNPRVKSELFMLRRSATGEKFSQLVTLALEKLILILNSLFEFFFSRSLPTITHKRAQIMSIRGLALSCAPNFTRKDDIKLLSRSNFGIA